MRCHQHLAGSKPRANITLKHFAVMLIGDENHDDIGLLSSASRCRHLQALGFSLLAALAAGRQAYHDTSPVVTHAHGISVSLAPASEHRRAFPRNGFQRSLCI